MFCTGLVLVVLSPVSTLTTPFTEDVAIGMLAVPLLTTLVPSILTSLTMFSQVPFFVSAWVVVEPSKVTEVLASLPLSDASTTAIASPLAIASEPDTTPPLDMLPWSCAAGVTPDMVTSVIPVTWPSVLVVICGTVVADPTDVYSVCVSSAFCLVASADAMPPLLV